jgi:hypothetical protein
MLRICGCITFSLVGVMLTLAFGAVADEKKCSGLNMVPHKDGQYDFTYESWVKRTPNRDHYDFGRCVQNNLKDRSMFVDWKRTNVKGFAKAKDLVESGVESPGKDFDLVDAKLWYGAAPSSLNAPYREVKQGTKPQHVSVRSWVRMAVPTDSNNPDRTLVSIDANFISDVLKLPNGRFMYRYLWRDPFAATRKPVTFVWRSEAVSRAMRTLDSPEALPLASDFTGSYVIDPSAAVYGLGVVEFLDEQRRVVGSAPTALYYPSGLRQ